MNDLVRRIGLEGPLVPDGKGGYTIDGKKVDRQLAFAVIANGFTTWNRFGHFLNDKGAKKAGLVQKKAA